MLTQIESLQDLYEKDFILWIEKNIQAMKDGKFNIVDFENVIEELATLGRSYHWSICRVGKLHKF